MTLLSVLVVGAIGLAVTVSLLLLGLGSARTSFAYEQSGQARALAEACAEDALQQIRDDSAFTGTDTFLLGQGTCIYSVTNTGGQNRTIMSTSTVGTMVRKVKVMLNGVDPEMSVTSWQDVADF